MAETRRPFQVRFSDPLSQVTRTERKVLLGVSIAALVLVQAGIVPTRIAALGIEFSTSDQRAIVRVAAFVIAYFLISFFIYAMNDYIAWNTELRGAMGEWMKSKFMEDEAAHRVKARADSPVTFSGGHDEEREVRAREYVEDQMRRLAASPLNTRVVQVSASTIRTVWDFLFPVMFGFYATVVTFQAASRPVPGSAEPPAAAAPALDPRTAPADSLAPAPAPASPAQLQPAPSPAEVNTPAQTPSPGPDPAQKPSR